MKTWSKQTSCKVLSLGLAAIAVLAAPLGSASAYPRPATTTQVDGGTFVGTCLLPACPEHSAISADGRYVAFISQATDLVPGDLNLMSDIFRYDRASAEIEIASVSSNGVPGTGPGSYDFSDQRTLSYYPSISADGRYVSFASAATNLVPGDTNGHPDVFVHDFETGNTERVSVTSDGREAEFGQGTANYQPKSSVNSISADGRLIAFQSDAFNLTSNDSETAPWADVFVHDRKTGETRIVSSTVEGLPSNAGSLPSISGNGRSVAFFSSSNEIVEDDGNSGADAFVYDLKTEAMEIVSVTSDGSASSGATAGATAAYYSEAISADGRYVVFHSGATNLVPNDRIYPSNPLDPDVFLRDRKNNRTYSVSVTSTGGEAQHNAFSLNASISANGRFVVFESASRDLVDGDTDTCSELPLCSFDFDVFVHDRATGLTEMLSRTSDGTEARGCGTGATVDATSIQPAISGTGRFATFTSCAANLRRSEGLLDNVANTNNPSPVFLRDRGPALGLDVLGSSGPGGSTSIPGPAAGSVNAVLAAADGKGDVPGVVSRAGGNLIGARLVHRPSRRDLFLRLELEEMPRVDHASIAGNPALLYGLEITVDGRSYELRAQRVTARSGVQGGDASFGLFDCNEEPCTQIRSLEGGYGTTGVEVVAAVPLGALGLEDGGEIDHALAYTAVGSFELGRFRALDEVALLLGSRSSDHHYR